MWAEIKNCGTVHCTNDVSKYVYILNNFNSQSLYKYLTKHAFDLVCSFDATAFY